MSVNRKGKEAARAFLEAGWIPKRSTNHQIWVHPILGIQIAAGKTSSDHRAYANNAALIRRLERAARAKLAT